MNPYNNLGGGAQVARQLEQEAKRRGLAATLVHLERDRIQPARRKSYRTLTFGLLLGVWNVVSELRVHKDSVIIGVGDSATFHAVLARTVARSPHVPVVLAHHQPRAFSAAVRSARRLPAFIRSLLARLIDSACSRVDAHVFLTEDQRATYIASNGDLDVPAATIPNAVRFTAADLGAVNQRVVRVREGTQYRLLHVGTFSALKNQALAIQVLAFMDDERVALSLVGSGSQEECRKIAEGLGVSDRVTFWGSMDDMLTIYDEHDVLLSTALTESFGLTALEGLVRGLLVVGPKSVPLFSSLSRQFSSAAEFEGYEPASVAHALRRLIHQVRDGSIGAADLHAAAQDCAARFDSERFIEGHVGIVQSALECRARQIEWKRSAFR